MIRIESVETSDVREFLASHLGHHVESLSLAGQGAWSRCYGFTHAGADLVIRFAATDEDFRKDERAAAFTSASLPIPAIIEIGAAFDGYFAISTRSYGKPLEAVTAGEWQMLRPSLLAMLGALHNIDLSDTRGFGGWDRDGRGRHQSWAEYLLAVDEDTPERRTHGWSRKLADSIVGVEPFTAGLRTLRALVGDLPEVRHMIHADLVNGNAFVDKVRISAVFDWGCAAYGDFLYDVAWLEFWAPWHPGLASFDIRRDVLDHYRSIGLDVAAADLRLRCCLIHIGLDHQAYCAHTGDQDNLVRITNQTLDLLS